MKHILNIIKKELDKVIKNPRLFLTTFILPGLLIFGIYATMGNLATEEMNKVTSNTSVIYVIDVADSFESTIELYNQLHPEDSHNALNADFIYYKSTDKTKEELDNDLKEGLCNAYVIFDENFDEDLNNRLNDQSLPLPKVDVYMLLCQV